MKHATFKLRTALIATPLTIAGLGFLVAATPATPTGAAPTVAVAKDASPSVPPQQAIGVANALSDAFRNVAKHVLPSVVAIENRPDSAWQTGKQSTPQEGNPLGKSNPFKGTPFEDMFPEGLPMNPGQANPHRSPRSQGGIGSGVIIDSAGVVLTNNHVVAGGGTVTIKTQDGREFIATEVLTDSQTDIAVVKFKGDSNLVAAKIGNSDAMEVGDWVVALGQPFGLESTVTAGIVSAKNRGIGITDRESFIQTDAAINPGNSGGPLVNLQGEVIGINTAISSSSGGNSGVGFAVPSNLAHWVSDQLLTHGHVNRSYLGVSIQPVNYELSTQLGVAPRSGVAVTNVFPQTPAAKAGLKAGDVIVSFDGVHVTTPQELQLAVEKSVVGKPLMVAIVRDGKSIELSYNPEAAPSDSLTKTSPTAKPDVVKEKSLGLEISSLTKDIAQQLGMENQTGVVITAVQPDSSAAKAGLEAGMVIAQVNRQVVTNAEDFGKVVSNDEDGSILLLVRTEQGSRFVVVNK